MKSKECLERIIFEAKMEKPIFSMYYQEFLQPIEQDLDRLEKLEKVIEILKKALLLNVKEIRGLYYVLGYDTNYCMTKEEFELLKGVLENDKSRSI